MDIEELKKLALEATPGPWEHYHNKLRSQFKAVINEIKKADGRPVVKWSGFDGVDCQRAAKKDAAYIAAANPAAVLELISEIAELRHAQDGLFDRLSAATNERDEALAKLVAMESQEDPNHCALKSITDDQVRKVAKAFWRRIYAYRNDYGIELPDPMPVEFMAHMATALTWVDKPVPADKPRITEQDAREIADNVMEFNYDHKHSVDYWMREEGCYLLNKLNADREQGGGQ